MFHNFMNENPTLAGFLVMVGCLTIFLLAPYKILQMYTKEQRRQVRERRGSDPHSGKDTPIDILRKRRQAVVAVRMGRINGLPSGARAIPASEIPGLLEGLKFSSGSFPKGKKGRVIVRR